MTSPFSVLTGARKRRRENAERDDVGELEGERPRARPTTTHADPTISIPDIAVFFKTVC